MFTQIKPSLGSLVSRMTVRTAESPREQSAVASAPAARVTLVDDDDDEKGVDLPDDVVAAGTHAVPGRKKVVLQKGFSQMDWMR